MTEITDREYLELLDAYEGGETPTQIARRKGLPGAKPAAVCRWILDWLNVQAGDEFRDLFPGTGVMTDVARERCEGRDAAMTTAPLFGDAARGLT